MVAGVGSAGAATFAMDVQSGATVTYSWLSDVIKALDGSEQRIARLAKPRQRYEFSSLLTDAQQRTVLAVLSREAAAAPVFLLGLAFEDLPVLSSTSTTITVSTLTYCDWDEPGQRIIVVSKAGVVGEAVVQSSAGDVLTVDADLTALATDGARVMPAMQVFLDAEQTIGRYQTALSHWEMKAAAQRFRFGSAGSVGAGATVNTFEGLPVWDRGTLATGVVPETIDSGAELVDLGGALATQQAYEQVDWGRTLSIEATEPAEWQWFKKFLDTVNGPRLAFLRPTGRPDLVPIGDASSGTLVISAAELNYVNDWYPSLAHRRVRIVLTSGTAAYRTIVSAEDNGNGTQNLALNASLAGALSRVEFLETCRIEDDEIQVQWDGATFESSFLARVVQQFSADVAPTTYAGFEASVQSGEPVDLYTFQMATTTWRMTSSEEDVTFGSLFTATPIDMGDTTVVALGQVREVTISLPLSHALAQSLIANGIPPRDVVITIDRHHRGSAVSRRVWRGYVGHCRIDEQFVRIEVPNATDDKFAVQLPLAVTQKACNHDLYDVGCVGPGAPTETPKTNRNYGVYATQGWMVACTVVSQVDTTLVVSNMNNAAAVAHPDQWAKYGEVRHVTTGERRSILSHVGTTLILDVPFGTIAAPNDLEVYAGCDHARDTCKTKFNNLSNFGGHPDLPATNQAAPRGYGMGTRP